MIGAMHLCGMWKVLMSQHGHGFSIYQNSVP